MDTVPTDLTAGPLHLRPWRPDLVPGLAVAASGWPHAAAWVARRGGPSGRVGVEQAGWADGTRAGFAVLESTTADIVGHVGLLADPCAPDVAGIGLWVVPAHQGRGVGRRVLGVVCRWAFATGGLARVAYVSAVTNAAARHAAEAAGFRAEGVARSLLPGSAQQPGRVDAWLAAVLPGEV